MLQRLKLGTKSEIENMCHILVSDTAPAVVLPDLQGLGLWHVPIHGEPFLRSGRVDAGVKRVEHRNGRHEDICGARFCTDWPYLHAFWKHKVLRNTCRLMYCVGVLLTNTHTCIIPNQTSVCYGVAPPELHEYFHQ
jgi:hypothetical protein